MSQGSIALKEHHVAHHFETAEQEFDAAKIGMWAFIGQEILFFSALFVAYAIFRSLNVEMFQAASKLLNWKLGALNTTVLIASSFTMVMAVRSAQLSRPKNCYWFLAGTIFFATLFMVVKYFEYTAKIDHGLLPSRWFAASSEFETMPIFFGLYFVITGLHGLHIVIGIGLIAWLMVRTKKGEFHAEYFTPVEMVGLYWHFVDIVWIFLFPLLYLL